MAGNVYELLANQHFFAKDALEAKGGSYSAWADEVCVWHGYGYTGGRPSDRVSRGNRFSCGMINPVNNIVALHQTFEIFMLRRYICWCGKLLLLHQRRENGLTSFFRKAGVR